MTAAASHQPSELRFIAADDTTDVVTYAAPSASQPGCYHAITLDTETYAATCSCRAAAHRKGCWHIEQIVAAWESHPAMAEVAGLSDDALLRYGKKLAAYTRQYRERCGRPLAADATNLVAARDIYRRRALAATETADAA